MWFCHDCAHVEKSLAGARRHAKASLAYRGGGRFSSHKLTQDEAAAVEDRPDE